MLVPQRIVPGHVGMGRCRLQMAGHPKVDVQGCESMAHQATLEFLCVDLQFERINVYYNEATGGRYVPRAI